jgi:thiol-disulfide isomerase/thioredoxin
VIGMAAALAVAGAALGFGLLRSGDDGGVDQTGRIDPERRSPAPALPGGVLVPPAVSLGALRGAPVVVNFWASWCVPCRREAPDLARFARQRPAGARLVGVNYRDRTPDALAFVREFDWRFPNVRDPAGKLGDRYAIPGLPTTYVIDAQGRIAARLTGAQTVAQLTRAVEAAGR